MLHNALIISERNSWVSIYAQVVLSQRCLVYSVMGWLWYPIVVVCCGWLFDVDDCLRRLLTPRFAWLGRRVHLAEVFFTCCSGKTEDAHAEILLATFIGFGFRHSFDLVLIHSFKLDHDGLWLILVLFTVSLSRNLVLRRAASSFISNLLLCQPLHNKYLMVF